MGCELENRVGPRAWSLVLVALGLGSLAGCMHDQLRYTARRTSRTLPDLQYQQVIDNLALIAANPGYLPYLAVVGQGAVQVTDSGNSSLSLTMAPRTFTSTILGFAATRNVTGTWSVGTVTSPEKLRQMQLIYRQAAGRALAGDPSEAWLHVGCRRDVPRDAVYVGRHGKVFVWVDQEGIDGLSGLTLRIMDVATREDTPAPAPHALYGGERPEALPSAVPRRNFQVPPTGPIYTPGTR